MEHLYLKDGKVNPKLTERPVIIWGCGNDGKRLCRSLQLQGINPLCFCDSKEALWGTMLLGIPVLPVAEALRKENIHLALAFHQWIHTDIPKEAHMPIFADFPYEEPAEDAVCILCSSGACTYIRAHFAPFLMERMFRGGKDRAITRLLHCNNCNFRFSEYRPTDDEMARLYDGYRNAAYVSLRQKYEPEYTPEPFVASSVVHRRKENLNRFLTEWMESNSVHSVLDYGGDEGQYIPDLFCGAEKYVFEISGNRVQDGVTLLRTRDELRKRKFDFIMCCHVLEHMSNPLAALQDMIDSLAENGTLYIEVPNQNDYDAYSDVEINEHINFYSKDTLEKIADKMKLQVIKIESKESHRGLFCVKS